MLQIIKTPLHHLPPVPQKPPEIISDVYKTFKPRINCLIKIGVIPVPPAP